MLPWKRDLVLYLHGKQEAVFHVSCNLLPSYSKVASLDVGLWCSESQVMQSSVCPCPCLGPQPSPHWTRVLKGSWEHEGQGLLLKDSRQLLPSQWV